MTFTTNLQNIVAKSEKSLLIKIEQSEYKFWIAKKMVRELGGWAVNILIPDEWTMRVFRNGKAKHNYREILDEQEVNVEEFKSFYPEDKVFDS